jgi:phosphate transport system protein
VREDLQVLRGAYHETLAATRAGVVRLGVLAREVTGLVTSALESRDLLNLGRVFEEQDRIDNLSRGLRQSCTELLWRQQPLASEFRLITAMLQIVTDLNDVGRHAVDIAKHAFRLRDAATLPAVTEITAVAKFGEQMLGLVMLAFETDSVAEADRVIEREDELDRLYHLAVGMLRTQLQQPENVDAGTNMLFIVAAVYRVGGHACNIAWHVKEMDAGGI